MAVRVRAEAARDKVERCLRWGSKAHSGCLSLSWHQSMWRSFEDRLTLPVDTYGRTQFPLENLAQAMEHEAMGNSSSAFECYQKAVDISPAIALELI
ncbi:hypothetical protein ZIOFF_026609 [Zingiber officinale]|uniref:Uncharacterized protein n=1 Tax=Zingiber officinale TaxID=94328 RepID=A0A8J5GXQ2_ZINOF|nr:hypothetical protein ZIOFF_026609 [Zingiber officinale]